jgi:hypothetical protein
VAAPVARDRAAMRRRTHLNDHQFNYPVRVLRLDGHATEWFAYTGDKPPRAGQGLRVRALPRKTMPAEPREIEVLITQSEGRTITAREVEGV